MRRIVVAVVLGALGVTGCSRRASNDAHVSPWSTVGIGSVFVSRSVTRMEKPFAHVTETTTKQTLVARTGSEASVKIEISEGSATAAQDVKIPLREDLVQPHDGSTVTTSEETCTVPAGTFQCTRTTVEMTRGDATSSSVTWTTKQIPVPLRSIVTNENMTVTTELTNVTGALPRR
ncbi:MAG: hypothetical protein H0V89_13545 [Deltaproteobacteria bacterium]|nr:hypothetical protein [Deltaproteobacteria bacterium]